MRAPHPVILWQRNPRAEWGQWLIEHTHIRHVFLGILIDDHISGISGGVRQTRYGRTPSPQTHTTYQE